jgi:hypothetical protein
MQDENKPGDHDDDLTVPDIPIPYHGPKGQVADDTTVAIAGILVGLHRTVASLEELASACPPIGAPGWRRNIEVFAGIIGQISDLGHATRRDLYALIREQKAKEANARTTGEETP